MYGCSTGQRWSHLILKVKIGTAYFCLNSAPVYWSITAFLIIQLRYCAKITFSKMIDLMIIIEFFMKYVIEI